MLDIAIESVDFRKAWQYVSSGQYSDLTDYLSEKVECLKSCGAEIMVLTAGIMHIVYDRIVQKTNASLISISKLVSDEAVARACPNRKKNP